MPVRGAKARHHRLEGARRPAGRAVRQVPQQVGLRLPAARFRRQGQLLRLAHPQDPLRHAPAHLHLGAARLHRMGLEELPVVAARRVRQLPDDAQRPGAPPADAPGRGEPVPPVPGVHLRPEVAGAQDGDPARHPVRDLRRERGRVRQPDRRHQQREARLVVLHFVGQVEDLPGRHLDPEPVRRLRPGGAGPAALPARRPGADREEADRGALPRVLPQVAPAKLLLLRGGARRLRGLARAHAGHVQQVQQHRRPHRRLPLLHDLHQVRHRPRDLRRGAGDPLRRHHARRGRGAGEALRRRIPGALRRRNLPLPERSRRRSFRRHRRCSSRR